MALDITVADAETGIDVTVVSGETGTKWKQRTVTSDTTADIDESVWADASSNTVTVTLPSTVQSAQARVIAIDAANTVTVTAQGTTTITDHTGAMQSITLTDGESISLESDGSQWWVV